MLRIRLQRTGRRNQPFYRLVVAEHARPVKGKYLELLGHYNPLATPKILEFKAERVSHWVSVGAQPSQTVAHLLLKKGLKEMEKFIETRVMKPSKAEVEAKQKAAEAEAEKKAAAEAAKKAKEEAAQQDEAAAANAPETPVEEPAAEAPAAEMPAVEPTAEAEPEASEPTA